MICELKCTLTSINKTCKLTFILSSSSSCSPIHLHNFHGKSIAHGLPTVFNQKGWSCPWSCRFTIFSLFFYFWSGFLFRFVNVSIPGFGSQSVSSYDSDSLVLALFFLWWVLMFWDYFVGFSFSDNTCSMNCFGNFLKNTSFLANMKVVFKFLKIVFAHAAPKSIWEDEAHQFSRVIRKPDRWKTHCIQPKFIT